jgi:DNA-binding NarL/FixJ family response regulator
MIAISAPTEANSAPAIAHIRVLIADGRPVVSAGLGYMLTSADEIAVAGFAADAEELLAMSAVHRPDVVLVDLDMPGGIAATRELVARAPETQVIGLTLLDGESALDALDVGAVGCLFKDCDVDELVDTVQAAGRGEPLVGSQTARLLIRARSRPGPAERLTPRQRQIVALVAGGASNKAIAQRLKIAEGTAKSSLTAIYRRLGFDSRTQLALWAQRQGIGT